jgi:uncharacterized damage-inducible protein DinB
METTNHISQQTLGRLFQYKAWANVELLSALARLDAGSPVTPLAIKALSHTYVVDRIFAAHLRGQAHAFSSANLARLPSLDELSAQIRTTDREYLHYVASLDREQLSERIDFTFTDGAPGRMSREEMLLHVITHGIGHRGQVSAVLLLDSRAPPADGFTTYLHRAEVDRRARPAPALAAS